MSDAERKIVPTVERQTGLKVQIPDTAEGREFLEKLKQLLKVEHLPFTVTCQGQERHATSHIQAAAAPATQSSGSTTYALDLRLEQEGWAP